MCAALSHVSPTLHKLLPVALILVTSCSDNGVKYYSKCGSGRIKLEVRFLLCVSGHSAS